MPRKPRLFVAGGFYHVVLRGNGRADIFFEHSDREAWQSLLQKGLERYGHCVHAYCWMTNHVHLLLQAGDLPLSKFLGTLAGTYAKLINGRVGRGGHLFERRYRASLVQQDSYLLEVVRYIHLNPVRALMAESPDRYPWSSHHAYAGGPQPRWLTTRYILDCFGPKAARAREAYLRYIKVDARPNSTDAVGQLSRMEPSDEQLIGDDDWKRQVLTEHTTVCEARSLDELVGDVCQRYGINESQLRSSSRQRAYSAVRAEIALVAIEEGIATLTQVARRFGRAHSGLSRAVNRLRDERQ